MNGAKKLKRRAGVRVALSGGRWVHAVGGCVSERAFRELAGRLEEIVLRDIAARQTTRARL